MTAATGMAYLSMILAVVALPATLYLAFLTFLSRVRAAPAGVQGPRFAIVVPAHNEEAQIAATVTSLRAVQYPTELFSVIVVADNCTDATAQRATDAGAHVLVRTNAELRGKGYALEHAFEHVLGAAVADAIVVVDADSVVSTNLLQAFAARLEQGESAVQAEYGVRNPLASWRTRLMTIALAMFHRVRSLGRESLGVSAGLRGNGMCFTCELLRDHPHKAYGLVEDVEYGLALGRAGVRIAYADEAKVLGEMVSSGEASQTQRERWEGGRLQLVRRELPSLIADAVAQRRGMLLDLAMDLAVPPLSSVATLLVAGMGIEGLNVFLLHHVTAAAPLWILNVACLSAYVGRGVMLSGLGWRAVVALLWAPVYIVWKVFLKLKPGSKNAAWIRTRRESERPS